MFLKDPYHHKDQNLMVLKRQKLVITTDSSLSQNALTFDSHNVSLTKGRPFAQVAESAILPQVLLRVEGVLQLESVAAVVAPGSGHRTRSPN